MAARITAYLVALIVGVTFIAGLIVGAQRDDGGPVDLIVVNGSVYTADGDNTMAEAVAVQGNKILLVGTNREVQRLRRPQTVVVDAKGGAVLPGLNDSVADFIGSGIALKYADLSEATTEASLESEIKAWASVNPDEEWVLGRGWTPEVFEGTRPTRQRLDELVPDRPALVLSEDGHSAWVNSAALARANITRRSQNPAHGTIARDTRSGQPAGLLTGSAIDLVTQLLPVPTRDDRLTALRTAIDEAHRRGVTSVQDTRVSLGDLELYDALRREQDLDIRVYAAVRGETTMTHADLDALDELRIKYADDPLFKTGAVSLVADEETSPRLRALVAELDERGWQVIIQAIGEGAVQMAKDAVDYARGRTLAAERDRRHRVEAMPPATEPQMQGVQFAAGEKRTLLQAVDAHTREAAWASFDEHRKGTLERDMLADLVILRHDIFADPPGGPVDTEVAITIFDGRIVYSRSTETNE